MERDSARPLDLLRSCARKVLMDLYPRGTGEKRRRDNPFALFRKRHLARPNPPLLIRAHCEDDSSVGEHTYRKITREDWRGRLASIQVSDTGAGNVVSWRL